MNTIELLLKIADVHPQRYDMLIEDIEDYHTIVGDRSEREITLNALKYCRQTAAEHQERERTRKNYEYQFGKDWH